MRKLLLAVCLITLALTGFSWYASIPSGNYGWALPALDSPYYRYPSYNTYTDYAYYFSPSYSIIPANYYQPVYNTYPSRYTLSVPASYYRPVYATYPVRTVSYPLVTTTVSYTAVPVIYYPYGVYYPNLSGW
jgi:hypothetical protein